MDIQEFEVNVEEHDAGFALTLHLPGGKQVVQSRGLLYQPYRNGVAEAGRKATQEAGRDGITMLEQERIEAEQMAEHLLIGWDGMTAGGQPLPWSRDQGRKFLTDRRYRHFFEGYRTALIEQRDQTVADRGERLKNSDAGSEPN